MNDGMCNNEEYKFFTWRLKNKLYLNHNQIYQMDECQDICLDN